MSQSQVQVLIFWTNTQDFETTDNSRLERTNVGVQTAEQDPLHLVGRDASRAGVRHSIDHALRHTHQLPNTTKRWDRTYASVELGELLERLLGPGVVADLHELDAHPVRVVLLRAELGGELREHLAELVGGVVG